MRKMEENKTNESAKRRDVRFLYFALFERDGKGGGRIFRRFTRRREGWRVGFGGEANGEKRGKETGCGNDAV